MGPDRSLTVATPRSNGTLTMRTYLADVFSRLADWLRPSPSKAMPPVLAGAQWSGTSFIDAYRRNRNPTPNEILAELKNTAWTCASINAAVCASFPPRLYVTTPAATSRGPSA